MLVQQQIDKAKRGGRIIDEDTAYEEVVADSCESFLRDSKLLDKLIDLAKKDMTLFERTQLYIDNLLADLRKCYKGFKPDSFEGKKTLEMTECIERLHELWEEAAISALDNSQKAGGKMQKNTTDKGDEVVRLSQRDNSDNSIKDQLKANLDALNSMEPVASVKEIKTFKYKQQTLEWVLKRLENTGYKVNRKGFGEIIIDKKRLKKGLSYSKTNEEQLAFAALPQVLAKGVEIDTHIKHKNRAYDTITFAAPVVINGQRGNMAVVVRQEGKNYYKVHRLVMPDGSQFILNKKRDTAETAGGVENNSGLSPTDNVSTNSILNPNETVKENSVKKSDRDSLGNNLTADQQEYFANSKVRDDNGNLMVVYHGTCNADFTVFKRNVNYFTDSKEMADSYSPSGEMFEGYLNIKKPYILDAKSEKWSKIPIDEETKSFIQGYGASVFKEGGQWRTTPADIASAIEEAIDSDDVDYDGIIIKNIDDTGSYHKGKDKHLATDYIVFNSNQFKNIENHNPTANKDIRYSVREIIGEDGTNYGMGVYLDSQKLSNLSEKERIDKVREHIKELGGHPFSAFDNDDNEVKIKVAPKTKYLNEKGKWERANRHLTNFVLDKEKQESLILIEEIIAVASFKEQEPAKHKHGWLDNNGKNEWDVWTTHIQDKENTIWDAKLKIANTTNGEKVLYDVYPIEKVGPGRTMPEKPTNENISQNIGGSQEKNSLRDPEAIANYEKISKQLSRENAKLTEDVLNLKELLKLQRTVTHGKTFTKSSLSIVAKRLMSYMNAKGNSAELTGLLNNVYTHIAEGKDVSWDSIRESVAFGYKIIFSRGDGKILCVP